MKPLIYIIIFIIATGITSCSVQSKLIRDFSGKDKAFLDNHFNQNGLMIELSDKKAVVYTKTKILGSIPVNKGVTTLDPMVSPSVEKKEKFVFYLDNSGKVNNCKYEKEYKR